MPAIRLSILLAFIATLILAEPIHGKNGTVVATEDGGGYTYVQLDLDGEKVWYAVPATEIKLGEKVVAPAGMAMKGFYSKALDRTFETVYFAESLTGTESSENSGALPPGHPPLNANSASFDFASIERPEGGKTVAEIHQESAQLSEKKVIVRGVAVKVTKNIMGKNWIHLRDGTGTANSNDLTVTTTDSVKTGSTVTASGTLAINRDFGSGYKYAVLLEDASMKA
jgi:hypothetical protein